MTRRPPGLTRPVTPFPYTARFRSDGTANNQATIDYIRGSNQTIDSFKTWSAALRADGPLVRLPAGDVRTAAGAEYRREANDYFRIHDQSTPAPLAAPYPGLQGTRHVNSLDEEILVPVLGPDNEIHEFHKYELT